MALVGAAMGMMSGTLVYYHCAYRDSSVVSLFADVLIVLLCSLAILGLLFRHMNIAVPVDPLHWQISQDAASSLFACLANTLGAAESVLRVAATGHDKRLFLKSTLNETRNEQIIGCLERGKNGVLDYNFFAVGHVGIYPSISNVYITYQMTVHKRLIEAECSPVVSKHKTAEVDAFAIKTIFGRF